MQQRFWRLRSSCSREQVDALARDVGLSATTASVLVRRGYADPDSARAFLAAELPAHDSFLLGDMASACDTIRAAVLAPVLVLVAGAVAGLVVLWTRVGWQSLRRSEHPWRWLAVGALAVALLVGLSLLGVRLPRE